MNNKLYKYRHEIIPYCGAGLAPRNYLVNGQWKMLMAKRTEEIRGRFCELCKSTEKLDFHESFEIKNCVYILKGMFWLCRKCHGSVHIKSNQYDYPDHVAFIRAEINKKIFKASNEAFKFSTNLNVSVDYSWLGKYGIDYVAVENKWRDGDYNHKYVMLRFITEAIKRRQRTKAIYGCLINEYQISELDEYSLQIMKCMFTHFKDFFIYNSELIMSGSNDVYELIEEYAKKN